MLHATEENLQFKVYMKGNVSFRSVKRPERATSRVHFWAAKKSRKRSCVVYSCFKHSAFTAVKRDAKF